MAQKTEFRKAPRPAGYAERNPEPGVPPPRSPIEEPRPQPLPAEEARSRFDALQAKFVELAAEVRKLGADLSPTPTKGAGSEEVFLVVHSGTQPPAETYLRGRHRLAEFLDMSPVTVGQYLSNGGGEFRRGEHTKVRRVLS